MPGVNKEQIAKAKQIDLLTYLRSFAPEELVQINRDTYSIRAHDSLKISNGKWYWFSRGIGGTTALNYLIEVQGYSFVEAVKRICGGEIKAAIQPTAEDEPEGFILPSAHVNFERVIRYLKGRGISDEVLRHCIQNKLIYESRDYHNAVFVGYDARRKERYAALRGTWMDAKKPFKGEVKGSDKRYSFSITPKERSDKLFVTESAIDALSVATLRKDRWEESHYLSVGGVYAPKRKETAVKLPAALTQYLKDHQEISKVVLCLDNDEVGRGASRFIEERLKEKGFSVWDKPPKRGKDYNELIISLNHNSM